MSKSKNTICLGVDEIIKRQTMPLYEYPEFMRNETLMEEASETLLELLKSYKKTAFDQLLGVYREPRIKHDFCYEKSHYGLAKLGQEKHLCRHIFFKNGFPLDLEKNLGRPIQYELNVTRSLNMGRSSINVDLVSYQEEKNALYLIEVKGTSGIGKEGDKDSPETLLRAILEIETYYRSLQPVYEELISDLKEDLNKEYLKVTEGREIKPLPKDCSPILKKAILVPKNCKIYDEAQENSSFPNTRKLMEYLQIEFYTFDPNIR